MKEIFREEKEMLEKVAKTLKEKNEDTSLNLTLDEDQKLINIRANIDAAYRGILFL